MPDLSEISAEHQLDVRPIEPKHRFEKIMGAYHDLIAVLELVDDSTALSALGR